MHSTLGYLLVGDELIVDYQLVGVGETTGNKSILDKRVLFKIIATVPTTFCRTCGQHWPSVSEPPPRCTIWLCDVCREAKEMHVNGRCMTQVSWYKERTK